MAGAACLGLRAGGSGVWPGHCIALVLGDLVKTYRERITFDEDGAVRLTGRAAHSVVTAGRDTDA